MSIPHAGSNSSPFKQAALLLLAGHLARTLKLPHASTADILQKTGASRTRAYELLHELNTWWDSWELKGVGRPPSAEPSLDDKNHTLTQEVLTFVMEHPGCVHSKKERSRYSEGFRHFILEMHTRYAHLPLSVFAQSCSIPLGTLKEWLTGGKEGVVALRPPPQKTSDPSSRSKIQTILEEWSNWHGDFSSFCTHVQHHFHIDFQRTLIGNILELFGVRSKKRREGRSPDEKALRDAFQTFFPGAQWVGDGKSITIVVGDQSFTSNLELIIDCQTAAAVGFSLRDEEDGQAVVEAFQDGIQTTGAPPLALLLDNKPSNDHDVVDLALADTETLHLKATLVRPQNKAHVEGAFGLFEQAVPPIVIPQTADPKTLAWHVLRLVLLTWARTLNHRPQRKHKGTTRVERYGALPPSLEEVERVRKILEERCRKQLLARETLKARQDPVVKEILEKAFARLNLLDPKGNIRAAIARYPLSAICDGIAIFEGKRNAQTLPDSADGRYLLGIVKNIAQKNEGFQMTEAFMRERLLARDLMLLPLQSSLELLQSCQLEPRDFIKGCLAKALIVDRRLDRLFWLSEAAKQISVLPQAEHADLIRYASRQIHATFSISHEDRLDMVRFLASKVMVID